jgi:predicted ferric reductase
MKRSLRAALWLSVYVGLVLAPLVLLLVVPTPSGGGFWWDLAMGLGFAGLVMLGVQFLLTARFKHATAPFGIDVIYYFHRYLAYVAVVALAAHPVIIILANPALLGYLNPLAAPWEITAGPASLALLLFLVGTSAWRKGLRIPYDGWRVIHLVLGIGAVGLGFAHMGAIGFYSSFTPVRVLWFVIGLSLLVVVLRVRLLRPWWLRAHPFSVVSVKRDLGDTWVLAVEPRGHEGFRFEPGQFAWVTLRHSPFAMKEHPFSIASAPTDRGSLEFAIKELGDFTRTVGEIESGETAYVDGPYGAFSIDRVPDALGYVFVAGGIGVAPVASMLRALAERGDRRRHVLFTAHGRWDRIPLREALRALEEKLDLRVVRVLESPPGEWAGEVGWITREMLERNLPEGRNEMEYFVCGPVPMIDAVASLLHGIGVPDVRVHSEIFDLV